MKSRNAIVVGGGVIGLFSAWALAERGWQVTLLERGEIGREASWAGGGILCPLYPWRVAAPVWELAVAGMRAYPTIAARLAQDSAHDPQWTRSGMRVLQAADVSDALAWCRHHGIAVELAHDAEGRTEIWLPEIAQIRNPRLCKAVADRLRSHGVSVLTRTTVLGMRAQGTATACVDTDRGLFEADIVVICAGAWSAEGRFARGAELQIRPVRGQMLLLQPLQPAQELRNTEIRLLDGTYLVPRRDGWVLVGSTVEEVGFDTGTTLEARTLLQRAAQRLDPGLSGAAIEQQWSGLRPGSPKGVPLIDRHPEHGWLWYNTGHHRNGICMAPAAAELLMQRIEHRAGMPDAAPYGFDRYAVSSD